MEATGNFPPPPDRMRKDVLVQLLEVSTREYDRHALVAMRGELDLAGAAGLRDRLRAACETAAGRVILDMGELSFIDSTGLAILVEYDQRTRHAGGRLVLVAPQPAVVRILGITGLDRRLTIRERLDEASEVFEQSEQSAEAEW